MMKTESIFQVKLYKPWLSLKSRLFYPSYKVEWNEFGYFRTLDDVEQYIQEEAHPYGVDEDRIDIYAYVVLEFPIGIDMQLGPDQYLSARIYLPDGTLWGKNDYANFIPSGDMTEDELNAWSKRNLFLGREPEEIKFQPGDIVEFLGRIGKSYENQTCAHLAVVVKAPPTVEEVSKMRQQYLETHSGWDLCDHAMSRIFNHRMDTYGVLYRGCHSLTYVPTISVFRPIKEVSSERRKDYMTLYEEYLSNNK